jgi:mannosyltransferase OCH1-like enzyme
MIIIIIIIYYYLLGYKLFGDDYKMKTHLINYYNKLSIIRNTDNKLKHDITNHKIIPLNIFQTWFTLNLSQGMKECVDSIKHLNPEFNYYLYDDAMCRQFIKDNFYKDVLNSYDSLIPGAYKADLWRYCILYTYGGIYLDIKFKPVNGFKFINLIDKEHFTMDVISHNITKNSWGLYNAFIITKKNNPILLKCIETIVNNVKNKYYGDNYLHPTGPALLGEIYFNSIDKKNLATMTQVSNQNKIHSIYPNSQLLDNPAHIHEDNDLNNVDLLHSVNISINYNYPIFANINLITYSHNLNIIYKNTIILKCYNNYRKDQYKDINNNNTPPHYSVLWKNRNIYK